MTAKHEFDLEKIKTRNVLVRDNMIFSGRGVRPDARQSVANIRPFVRSIAANAHPQISMGDQKSIVLVGLDSIKYSFAEQIFRPDHMVCMTSVFPSTSIRVWPSALTGYSPETFGSVGPVFYAKEIDALYNALDDSYRIQGPFVVDPQVTGKHPIGSKDNLFSDLNVLGFQTVCINGFYAHKQSRWSQAMQENAGRYVTSKYDWRKITMQPDQIVASIREDVSEALTSRNKGLNALVWTLSDIDCYVHEHGYSDNLKTALGELDSFFRDLASDGHLVIAFADHGQVPQVISTFTEGWDKIHSDENCRRPSGGAGRVRWSYPRAGREQALKGEIEGLLGDTAAVIWRDDLEKLGILSLGENLKSQIGEIVVLGLTEDFPLALHGDGFIFEHGSVSKDEMIVPLMIYKAAAKEAAGRAIPAPPKETLPAQNVTSNPKMGG
jgi:hypothetical protein